ncbi:MAG: hypothetical protein ABSF91_02850 [Bacteroidota bacterium]|jgi:hypothetical protein
MRTTLLHTTITLISVLVMISTASGQKRFLKTFRVSEVIHPAGAMVPSNGVSKIAVDNSDLWIGTDKGLAKSIDFSRSWKSYRSDPAFANDGIFALATKNHTIWASTGYEESVSDGTVQTGSGYAFSSDSGNHWTHLAQTLDAPGDSILSYGINDSLWMLPVDVPEQNVTFDISLSPGTVWIASWASGLRKSTDNGTTWQRIPLPPDGQSTLRPTDTLWTYANNDTLRQRRYFMHFDPRHNNNFLAFSVFAQDNDTIWCGTAGGVNKSIDSGKSWVKFSHQNQVEPILGDWVIAINQQVYHGGLRLWTVNWKADDPSEDYGVSYTDDGGRSWKNLLNGVKAYDISFRDSIAYIATDDGIFRTADGGLSFSRFSYMADPSTRQAVTSTASYTVGSIADTVFVGTGDGMASTIDDTTNLFGASWKIYRTYQPVGTSHASYAYPNPFSPAQQHVRIHYSAQTLNQGSQSASRSVSIDIFDFGMNRVRSLLHDAPRSAASEYDELWDGSSDGGKIVANGVYFYRITIDGGEPMFGKIIVLQ